MSYGLCDVYVLRFGWCVWRGRAGIYARVCGRSALRESSKYTRIGHHIPRAGTSARPTDCVMCMPYGLCGVCGEVGRAFMPAFALRYQACVNPANTRGSATIYPARAQVPALRFG